VPEVFEFIQREWTTLASAPFTFAGFAILAFGAAFFVARWRYEAIVEGLRERIAGQQERLDAKDQQVTEYLERLHLLPTVTAYSRLSNADLQVRTLSVVAEVRQFLAQTQQKQYDALLGGGRANYENMTEEERHRVWTEETNAHMRAFLDIGAGYDQRFKVDTIVLRDELLSRLPPTSKNERVFGTYEHPTNPIGMGMVADDLERLAKLLTGSAMRGTGS
jgi:hypothetical protein